MANEHQNNWSEYSRLVIAELERLNDGITKLNNDIQDLKREIAELKVKEDNVKELKKWKESVDDVTSPSQLKDIIKDVSELKTFKTQAITIWLVVQILFGMIMVSLNYLK
jgi:TolA-binding protein